MCVCVCVRVSGWSVKAVYLWLSGDCQTGCVVPPPTPLWMRKEESLYVARALQSLPPMAKTCQCAASSLEPLHN